MRMSKRSIKGNKTLLAIYDMDRTITRRATYSRFLLHMAWERAPLRLIFAPILPFGLLLYATGIWKRKPLKQFSQRLLVGHRVKKSELSEYLESHAKLVVGRNVYRELRERVKEEKSAGYRHVMATASYRLYVEAIAERLDFDDVVATDLATDASGHVLAQIDGHNCYDIAKLDKVRDWMAKEGLKREDCFIRAYSDHVSDAPLLEFSDKPFATNPHGPLRRVAKAMGWEIIDWR